jgi:competence protein ComGC
MYSTETQKGFSLVSILAVLVIGGLLYVGYSSLGSTKEAAPGSLSRTMSTSKSLACDMNRKAIESSLLNWTVRNPGKEPSLKDLKASGIPVPECPDGGRLQLQGDKVSCSIHKKR